MGSKILNVVRSKITIILACFHLALCYSEIQLLVMNLIMYTEYVTYIYTHSN